MLRQITSITKQHLSHDYLHLPSVTTEPKRLHLTKEKKVKLKDMRCIIISKWNLNPEMLSINISVLKIKFILCIMKVKHAHCRNKV